MVRAEITGMSGDVVECVVKNPPITQKAATVLAWQQYRRRADIVHQAARFPRWPRHC